MSCFFPRRWIRDWLQLRSHWPQNQEFNLRAKTITKKKKKKKNEEEEEEEEEEELKKKQEFSRQDIRCWLSNQFLTATGKAFFEDNTEFREGF